MGFTENYLARREARLNAAPALPALNQRKASQPAISTQQNKPQSSEMTLQNNTGNSFSDKYLARREARLSSAPAETIMPKRVTSGFTDIPTAESSLTAQQDKFDSLKKQVETSRAKLDEQEGKLINLNKEIKRYGADSRLGSDPIITAAYNNSIRKYQDLLPSYSTGLDNHNALVREHNAALEQIGADFNTYREMLRGQKDTAKDYISRAEALEKEADTLASRAKALARETGANGKWTNNTELSQARIRAWESAWGGTGSQDGSGTDNRTAQQLNDEADAKRKEAAQLRQKAETAEGYYYSSIPLEEDFAEKSKAAESKAGTLNPVYITEDQRGDLVYDFINNLNGTRETVKALNGWTGQDGAFGDYTPYTHMTDEEIGTYNYLYATQGKEEAERFLDKLANTLNYRLGTEKYENMGGLEKSLYWIPQGLDQFATGIEQLFSKEALPTTSTQYTGSMIQREAAELGAQRDASGQVQYDENGKMIGQSLLGKVVSGAYGVGTSVSNMAPSILVSYLTGGLTGGAAASGAMSAATAGKLASAAGTVAMGASAAGNAYKMKLDEGWTPDQARAYAGLVGLSESTLQYVIGGISALSGGGNPLGEKVLSKVLGQVAKVDNALARTALNVGARLAVSGFGEGLEEGLQEVLEPAFATLITGQEYEVDAGDVVSAFLMGYFTSNIFEAPGALRAAAAPTALAVPRFNSAGMDSYMGASGVDYFAGCQSAEDVKTRYRELAREHHPDAGGSQAVMAEINRQRTIRDAFYTGTQKATEAAQKGAWPGTDTDPTQGPEAAQRAREAAQQTKETATPQTDQFSDLMRSRAEEQKAAAHTERTAAETRTEDAAVRSEMGVPRPTETVQQASGTETGTMPMPGVEPLQRAQEAVTAPSMEGAAMPAPGRPELQRTTDGMPQNIQNGGNGSGQFTETQSPDRGRAGLQPNQGAAAGAVPDGRGQRPAGMGTGGPAGAVGGGSETRGAVSRLTQIQAANQRQNTARSLRLEKVSSRTLGLSRGTDTPSVTPMPLDTWDAEMQETAQRVKRETGKDVMYVLGRIPVSRSDGSVAQVRGVHMESGGIIIQADNRKLSVGQIADHETFHDLAARDPALNETAIQRLTERYGQEEIDRALDRYIESMDGLIDLPENATPEQVAAFYQAVHEELLADAYAGIDAYGARASQFSQTVNQVAGERENLRSGQNAAATDRTTGPPERYSFQERHVPTYEELIEKPDMTVVDIRGERPGRFADLRKNFLQSDAAKELYTTPVVNRDTGESVFITPQSITHTFSNLGRDQIAMVERLRDIVENAVLTHAEQSRKAPDDHTTGVYTLFAAVQTDEGIQPVKLKVKEYSIGKQVIPKNVAEYLETGQQQETYASVYDGRVLVLEGIEKEDASSSALSTAETAADKYPSASSAISIKDLMGLVKGDAARYIPAATAGSGTGDVQTAEQATGMTERYSLDEDDDIPQSSAEYVRMQREQQQEVTKKEYQEEKKTPKPVAESKPVIAKQDLKRSLMETFSTPEGKRAEVGALIVHYADKITKAGALTQQDRDALFDRMYSEGMMTVPADAFWQDARQSVLDGRIYVNDQIKADFGDDWNEFRKQAWAAGVYLVNDSSQRGPDSWAMELAESFPSLFTPDMGEMDALVQIVQMAEEGRDEKMSLAEYIYRLSGEEGVSESELLDSMEREMDWALRTYAEKADLEIKLRDRTGVKIAQEREKSGQRLSKERALEAQQRARDRDRRRELAQRQRERKELRELQQKTLKQLQWLSKNRNRAPEDLKAAFDDVLGDIDIYAVSAANGARWSGKYQATWRDLAEIYQASKDYDPNFLPSQDLEKIVKRLNGQKIGDLDVDALRDLYQAAVGLHTEFYNRNNVIGDEQHRLFAEVYEDAKQEIGSSKGRQLPKTELGVKKRQLLDDGQLTPMNFLQRMADWNPESQWYSMARQLEEGERAQRRFTVRAKKMLAPFLSENTQWAKTADGQGKDAVWYEIEVPELVELNMGDKPIFGETVKVYMTPAQKVHMALEAENYDNLRHMAGGRTFADKELYSRGKRSEAFAHGTTVKLAPETVKKIVSDLTEEERGLYTALKAFYNEFSKGEINRVSNTLYGYDKAMSGTYAPIYTDANFTKVEPGVFDVTAEGVGNLKSRQYAKNPSLNISAFDAFERSVDRTAKFVGLAIPVRNMKTLMNWRDSKDSMQSVISHKWDEASVKYIDDLLTELQAGREHQGGAVDHFINAALDKYISGVFGFNVSVVAKQFMSYPLAAAYLGWKGIAVPGVGMANTDLIGKYTAELDYRLMGYATPETAALKNNPGKLQEKGPLNFLLGGGSITAMDGFTVRNIWTWAENKVRREQPELETGTKEQIDAGQSPFYQAVAKEFEEAVSRSQPMYDVMHRSNIMREDGAGTRTVTLFHTVQQQELNMLRQAIGEQQYCKEHGTEKQQHEANRKTGRVFVGIMLGTMGIMGVDFLRALLLNKARNYRDDEGELTLESAGWEFFNQFVRNIAGLSVFGDVIADTVGAALGDRWYGIEEPGVEQLSTILGKIADTGSKVKQLVCDGVELWKGGGDFDQYMRDHSDVYLSAVKEAAATLATYTKGLPAANVEAYLLGAVQWISPEAKAAYEDALKKADKSGLAGLEGGALETRMDHLLQDRAGGAEDETVKALSKLYEAGYKDAAPAVQQTTLSINGEDRALNVVQQQMYKKVWSETVHGALDELAASKAFREADQGTQAKMLKRLYDYATEKAKQALFEDYEPEQAEKADAMIGAGASAAQWAAWSAESTGEKRAVQYEQVLSSDMSEEAKLAAVGNLIGTDMKTEKGEPSQWAKLNDAVQDGFSVAEAVGMIQDKTLDAYTKWRKEAGLKPKDAYELRGSLAALKPEDGKKDVTDMQKYRVIAASGLGNRDKVTAIGNIMGTEMTTESGNPSSYAKMLDLLDGGVSLEDYLDLKETGGVDGYMRCRDAARGRDYGITPEIYIRFRNALPDYDADGNGSFNQKEVKAALDAMGGGAPGLRLPSLDGRSGTLTNAQKAVLWQSYNKIWKAKGNPYDTSVGQWIYDGLNSATKGDGLPKLTLPSLSGSNSSGNSGSDELPRLMLPSLNG